MINVADIVTFSKDGAPKLILVILHNLQPPKRNIESKINLCACPCLHYTITSILFIII